MEKPKLIFSKSQSLVDFIISLGANTAKIIRNPQTDLRFFVIDGTELTGRVSNAVTELTADLRVSWVEPTDGKGKPSYMIHKPGSDKNTESTFSVQ